MFVAVNGFLTKGDLDAASASGLHAAAALNVQRTVRMHRNVSHKMYTDDDCLEVLQEQKRRAMWKAAAQIEPWVAACLPLLGPAKRRWGGATKGQPPRGFGQLALQYAPPAQARHVAGSLGQLTDVFWLAGHTLLSAYLTLTLTLTQP